MDNTRANRVAEEIKKEISDLLNRKLKDPRIGFVTVTDVELTNDLQHAKAFITVLGDEDEKEDSIKGLNKANGFIRTEIGKRIRLRKTPEIVFEYDDAHEHGNRIEELLKDIHKE